MVRAKDTLVISCGYCQLRIKEDNDKKKRCKCSFVMFCSNDCRRKSPHFKHCEGGDASLFNIGPMIEAVNLGRLPRSITAWVGHGLMNVMNNAIKFRIEVRKDIAGSVT